MKQIISIVAALAAAVPMFAAPKAPAELKVMSFNIRLGTAKDGTNSWEYRAPSCGMMIEEEAPDVIGLQEAMDMQVKYLSYVFEDYKIVGVGRDDGREQGERMAVMYNTKTLKLVKWGTYWLSETPDVPSRGWDAACNRTATWVLFKEKATGKKFYFVNTHLDHRGQEAQKNGMKVIEERIAMMNVENLPMVVTGDFNMSPDNANLDVIRATMKDARVTAVVTDNTPTFHGWGKSAETIDYIWYKDFGSCTEFRVVTKKYNNRAYVSDHRPVIAKLIF